MFLESQNQFRETMKLPDAVKQMDSAYAPLYAAWLKENKDVLYKWSPEERVERFTAAVTEHYEERIHQWIEASIESEEKKKDLKSMAQKGALILVSTDEGKTFDTVLQPEDLNTVNASDYQIFSPTLKGASTDLKQVQAEQELLHIVEGFQDQSVWGQQVWLVQSATIENGVAQLEVIHYQYGVYQVEVPLNEDAKLPLVYTFSNEAGKQSVPETQLPEKYGVAQPDAALSMPLNEQNKVVMLATLHEPKDDVKKAVLAGTLSMLAMQEAMRHPSSMDRANEAAALAKAQIEQPMSIQFGGKTVTNITAAKAAMAARFARQAKIMDEARKREMERYAKAKQIDFVVKKETKNAEKAKKSRFSADQKALAKGVGAGAGIAGAFAGALTGSALFVNHITLFS